MTRVFMLTGFALAAGCAGDGGSTSMADPDAVTEVPTAAVHGVSPTVGEAMSSGPAAASETLPDTTATEPPSSGIESVPEATLPGTTPEETELDPPPQMDEGESAPDMNEPVAPETEEMEAAPEMAEPPPEEEEEAEPPLVDEAGPAEVPLSFATDIWPLWSMDRDPPFVYRGMGTYTGCADQRVCHGSENPGGQLSMADQETAYLEMIDVPSVSSLCAGTPRVVVGDPENSCLILFYVGRLGKEDLDWVDDTEIELMREWIRQGALP